MLTALLLIIGFDLLVIVLVWAALLMARVRGQMPDARCQKSEDVEAGIKERGGWVVCVVFHAVAVLSTLGSFRPAKAISGPGGARRRAGELRKVGA